MESCLERLFTDFLHAERSQINFGVITVSRNEDPGLTPFMATSC